MQGKPVARPLSDTANLLQSRRMERSAGFCLWEVGYHDFYFLFLSLLTSIMGDRLTGPLVPKLAFGNALLLNVE
jgi:hypothetical protein